MEWTAEQIALVADLSAEGLSSTDISQQINRSRSSVLRKLKRLKRGDLPPNSNHFPWNAETDARLRGFYSEGSSFSQIAAVLGCSRNAAIGRAHRLGLNGKPPYVAPPKPKRTERQQQSARDWGARQRLADRAERQAKPQRPPRAMLLTEDDAAPTPLNLDILELINTTCKWPVTERPPHLFCGHATFGLRYCPYHERKSTVSRRTAAEAA